MYNKRQISRKNIRNAETILNSNIRTWMTVTLHSGIVHKRSKKKFNCSTDPWTAPFLVRRIMFNSVKITSFPKSENCGYSVVSILHIHLMYDNKISFNNLICSYYLLPGLLSRIHKLMKWKIEEITPNFTLYTGTCTCWNPLLYKIFWCWYVHSCK